jgi:hypothetical protein
MTSYDSTLSLESNSSSQTPNLGPQDNVEQFETIKQQKEIMEHGIEM